MGAAIYARISLDRLDGEGVDRQLADCRALAAVDGHHAPVEYVDNDISAYQAKRRPAWERLLVDLAAGTVTHLYAYHPDRLYRRLQDLEALIDAAQGVEIRTVKAGDIDLANASGRMLARILGSVTRHESERIGERVRRAKQERASQGRPAGGGKRPTGLDATRTHLVEPEAEMIRTAAARILAGSTWTAEARRLNQEGHRTTTEAEWTAGTLRRTLTSPYVAGLRSYKGQVIGPASWPPILDENTWAALRSRVQVQGARQSGQHLLTGHIRCASCARRMYANNSRSGWTYRCPMQESNGRGCGQAIMRDNADRIVLDKVTDWLSDPAFVDALRNYLRPTDTGHVELEEIEQRLASLARRFATGELLEFEHAAARHELIQRRQALVRPDRRSGPVDVDLPMLHHAWLQAVAAGDVPVLRRGVALITHPVLVHPRGTEPRVVVTPAWS